MNTFNVLTVPLQGRSLVDASAGTGKTYAIATLFVRLVVERGFTPPDLLVVTFTEAATSELRDRVRRRLQEARSILQTPPEERASLDATLRELLERQLDPKLAERRLAAALEAFDHAEISTIHGFCQRTLNERPFQSDLSYNSQLYGDPRPIVDDIVVDFWATVVAQKSPLFVRYMLERKQQTYGTAQRFNLEIARSLAYSLVATAEAQLLPEELPPPSDCDPAQVLEAFEHLKSHWQEDHVVGLVEASCANRRVYTKKRTPQWAANVTQFLQASDVGPLATPPEALSRFSSERLVEAGATAELGEDPAIAAIDAYLATHQRQSKQLDLELCRLKLELADYLRTELPRRARRSRALSFDDLLTLLGAALKSPAGAQLARDLRLRYPVAMIDEFQDTDPVQLSIFDRIYAGAKSDFGLFLIGDPKQAIYSFRGADVYSYIAAATATAPASRFGMETNYRSDPSMVAATNYVFSNVERPFLFREIQFTPVAPRPNSKDQLLTEDGKSSSGLELLFVSSAPGAPAISPAEVVAQEIVTLLRSSTECAGRPVEQGDIAVLTRTNDQAFEVQKALRSLGVRSVVLGDKSVFKSVESKELCQVLAAVVEPSNSRALRSALSTTLLGLNAEQLHQLESSDHEWTAWLERFQRWSAHWSQYGFVQMFRKLMNECSVQERLLSLPDGERRMTNLLQLVELMHSAALEKHLGPATLFAHLQRERQRRILGLEADAAQIRLESDARAVKITTMHKSKGLEYPIVYCPFLLHGSELFVNDRRNPKLHDEQGKLAIDLGSDDFEAHQQAAAHELLAENLRLAYVALTRAKHRCSVVWSPALRGFKSSAIAYLLHPPPLGSVEPSLTEIEQHLKNLSEENLLSQLESHAQKAPLFVRRIHAQQPAKSLESSTAAEPALQLRTLDRRLSDRYRTSSFSALISTRAAASEWEDRAQEKTADEHIPQAPRATPRKRTSAGSQEPSIALADFPAGARAGNFFHAVLEHYDFRDPAPENLTLLARSKLQQYDLDASLDELAADQIRSVLATELHDSASNCRFKLSDVGSSDRSSELSFCLPVHVQSRATPSDELTTTKLSQVFQREHIPHLPQDYTERVSSLGFAALKGFLQGFIDLVFRVGERYYLIDYKTNYLGPSYSDYEPAQLLSAMSEGHYFLQYHLYCLALQRHLQSRLRGYEHERHFGGVFYLFLRGMRPGQPQGIFFDRPSPGTLERLARALGAEHTQ